MYFRLFKASLIIISPGFLLFSFVYLIHNNHINEVTYVAFDNDDFEKHGPINRMQNYFEENIDGNNIEIWFDWSSSWTRQYLGFTIRVTPPDDNLKIPPDLSVNFYARPENTNRVYIQTIENPTLNDCSKKPPRRDVPTSGRKKEQIILFPPSRKSWESDLINPLYPFTGRTRNKVDTGRRKWFIQLNEHGKLPTC